MKKIKTDTILNVLKRAEDLGIIQDRMTLFLDLYNVNNIIDLDFERLANFNDFDFTHDIIGIQKNFNRQTKILENYFLPRCTK